MRGAQPREATKITIDVTIHEAMKPSNSNSNINSNSSSKSLLSCGGEKPPKKAKKMNGIATTKLSSFVTVTDDDPYCVLL